MVVVPRELEVVVVLMCAVVRKTPGSRAFGGQAIRVEFVRGLLGLRLSGQIVGFFQVLQPFRSERLKPQLPSAKLGYFINKLPLIRNSCYNGECEIHCVSVRFLPRSYTFSGRYKRYKTTSWVIVCRSRRS